MQLFNSTKPTENTQTKAHNIPAKKLAHVIVTGNEKGGSGKTTTTMHLIVALLRLGFKVGTMDIDSRQRTLSRYMENRKHTIRKQDVKLPESTHMVIQRSPFNIVEDAESDECERFTNAMHQMAAANDFVVIDSPGNDTYLSRLAHSYADTVITPINDSFVDLDVLATVDGSTMRVIRPSIYSEMVWEQKLAKAKRDGGTIEWIVMRNRLTTIDAKNKRYMNQVLKELSRRIGFRVSPGFSERVIYRELFLQGLTVLDIMDMSKNMNISISHVTARQEVRDLLKALDIPKINARISEMRTKPEAATKEANSNTEDATPKAVISGKPVVAKTEPALNKATAQTSVADIKTESAPVVKSELTLNMVKKSPLEPDSALAATPKTALTAIEKIKNDLSLQADRLIDSPVNIAISQFTTEPKLAAKPDSAVA